MLLLLLLDFNFSQCGVCSDAVEMKSLLLIMIIIIVFGIMDKKGKKTQKKTKQMKCVC